MVGSHSDQDHLIFILKIYYNFIPQVRRTSLHVLGKLSTIWPHRSLTDVPVFSLNSLVSSKICLDSDLEEIQLVDDAFIRVCCRLQDPSRSVRQLAAHIMADLAKVSY